MTDKALQAKVRGEIESLHRFFVDWFSGSVPAAEEVFQTRFSERFDERFQLIPPAGTRLELSSLATGIRRGHGSNPEFRIAIRNVQIRHTWEGHLLATYEEWQRNALASTPPDNGRIASVVFRSAAAGSATATASTLRWLHVHETWLPHSVMDAGPYDF